MKDAILAFLSFVILGVFFVATYFVFSGSIKTNDQTMLLLIGSAYGSVTTLASNVCAYWFGTTKTSSDKDKSIAMMAAKP